MLNLKKIKALLIITLSLYGTLLFSQQNRIGGSAVYNFHTRSIGAVFRMEFPINKIDLLEGISILPQVLYFPPFNPIHEFYLGSSIHLGLYSITRWSFYSLANISYNGWINHNDTLYREGKFSNPGIELGVGVSRKVKKCLYPFLELRYNIRWSEFTFGLGLMYTLKCDRRGAVPCPKIPPQPHFDE